MYGLVDSILEAHGRSPQDSGSVPFTINEFGQVLVPRGEQVYLAGEIEGTIGFFISSEPSVLSDPSDLSPGDPWPRPALGLPYHLSRRTHVYFQRSDAKQEDPPEQDWELVEALRDLCPNGPARFLVNPWGVATWKEEGSSEWTYVGKIRKEYWFEKEEGRA